MNLIIPLFEGISDASFKEFLEKAPIRRFPKGMVIFDQGEPSEEIFCVVSGEVEIVFQNDEGELKSIADLKSPSIFGEFSYLTGNPRSTAAVAKEETSLMELSPLWLREIEQKHPEVRNRILDLYRKRVLHNVLSQTKLFSVLTPEQIQKVGARMVLKNAMAGGEIIREGAKDLSLIILKKGIVTVSKLKGRERVVLGELGTGEVLGEMAIITGEPRSASVFAKGEVQYMELPGEDVKVALKEHPKLLKALEDIVCSRAEQTRKALEEVIDDVVGSEWTETPDSLGIQLESLKIGVQCTSQGRGGDTKLVRASLHHWELLNENPSQTFNVSDPISMLLQKNRLKDMESALLKDPIEATVSKVEGSKIFVEFKTDPTLQQKLSKILTGLAKARFRLFVYPEYDVSKQSLTLEFQTKSNSRGFVSVQAMSLTHARIAITEGWKEGEIAQIVLHQKNKEVLKIKALCLEVKETAAEIQFEYETGGERTTLEELLKQVSKQMGFGQQVASAPQKLSSPATKQGIVLTKQFNSPKEFVRMYMNSIESGRLEVDLKDALAVQTPVQVQVVIRAERGVRRFAFTGNLKDWNAGKAIIQLDEMTPQLREKIEHLCKKLVEEKTEATWKKRKKELAATGIPIDTGEASPLITWTMRASIAAFSLLLSWQGYKALNPDPSATEGNSTSRKADEPTDVEISFHTASGEVKIRTSELQTMKPDFENKTVEVQAGSKSFTISLQETEKFPAWIKKQINDLRESQKMP